MTKQKPGSVSQIEVGGLASWKIGGSRPALMFGRVAKIDGPTVMLRANGSEYEIHQSKLQHVPACPKCGNPLMGRRWRIRQQRYCSVECFFADRQDEFDELVLQTIIDHKIEYDGWSPNRERLIEVTGLAQNTIRESLKRLVATGKIQIVGRGKHRSFIVKGGRWIYEPNENSLCNK